jgi:glycosyltransferase involved in cell wall biosynthesis
VRVLILHSRYRSGSASGENRVVEDEARLLVEAGHHVNVFAPTLRNVSGLHQIVSGIRVVWSNRAATEVRRRFKRIRPDVVHCHNLFPALSPSVLREVGSRAATLMTLHNYRLLCLPGTFLRDGRTCEDCLGHVPWPGVLHGCYQDSVAASIALATSVVLHTKAGTFADVQVYLAISRFLRDKHVQGGLAPERVVVKPHFAWPGRQRQGPGEYFLYLGRLSPEKGVSTVLEAWQEVRAKLLIVGDGPHARYLQATAPSNVEFRPTVSPDEARALISSARAVLVPSISHEGAGKVVLEAYAAGVPVLASRSGGLPEVVDEEITGLLLPPGNAAAWADGVDRLLDDSESERMGRAANRLWEKQYSPEQGLARLEDAYHRALSQRGRSNSRDAASSTVERSRAIVAHPRSR